MKNEITRRFILGSLLASAADLALADAPVVSSHPAPRPGDFKRQATKSTEALIQAAGLSGKVGFVVADARTGLVLETENPLLAQPPASVTKVVTALYALDSLGGGYRFKTRLLATGPVVNGRLKGDLVLVGGGDPLLNTDDLADMAKALKGEGIREVTGKFKVHAGALPFIKSIDSSQPDYLGYNPSVSGLNLNFNRVHFEWKRRGGGYDITMDARAKRYRPTVGIAKMRIVNRGAPTYTYKDANGFDNWTVSRQALGKGGSRWLPVRKPHLYAGEVFQSLARSHGIKLRKVVVAKGAAKGTELVVHQSDDLKTILRGLLKYSNNMTAESVGLMASIKRGKPVKALAASAKQMTQWQASHLGGKRSKFVDHSGLSDHSHISASDMVAGLVKVGPDGGFAQLLKNIPLRDANGKVLKNHPIKVRAKTGTLNFVSALAGYISAPDGTQLAFAFFAADEPRRARIAKGDREAPQGGRKWNKDAKRLQQRLIERWVTLYSG